MLEVKRQIGDQRCLYSGNVSAAHQFKTAQLIHEDASRVYEYTAKGNLVAVVTDGTAVLGLGTSARKPPCR